MRSSDDHQSNIFDELCSLIFTILRPPHLAIPDATAIALPPPPRRIRAAARRSQISPAGFASLLLGASLALMLCGSVTFVIGFLLMPWVLGIVMFFHFVGILSNLSGLWKAVLSPAMPAAAGNSPKELSGQLFSKLPII